MGLADIAHAMKVEPKEKGPENEVIRIEMTPEQQVKVFFPDDKMNLEECGKIIFTALKMVLEMNKEIKDKKETDPKVLETLREVKIKETNEC